MDFLQIKQVLVIIFVLQIYFPIQLFNFRLYWTGPQLQATPGGSRVKMPQTQGNTRVERGFIYINDRGLFEKRTREGVWLDLGCPIHNGWPRLDCTHTETVSEDGPRITI